MERMDRRGKEKESFLARKEVHRSWEENIECPKINAKFAAIFASSCRQAWKKNSLTVWKFRVGKNGALYDNVEWIINREKVDAGFSSKIIPSDEAHFHLDGFDRQNCLGFGEATCD